MCAAPVWGRPATHSFIKCPSPAQWAMASTHPIMLYDSSVICRGIDSLSAFFSSSPKMLLVLYLRNVNAGRSLKQERGNPGACSCKRNPHSHTGLLSSCDRGLIFK